MVKVLSLFSGSLASRVATRLVERHPEVESVCLLHFRSPFAREHEGLRQLVKSEWPRVPYRTQSLKREHRRLIDAPVSGEFSLSQSCICCRRVLLHRAIRYMERIDAQFLVTGEIPGVHGVGGEDIAMLAEELDLDGRILRPLASRTPGRVPERLSSWAKSTRDRQAVGNPAAVVRRLATGLGLDPTDGLSSDRRCKLTCVGFGRRVAHLFHETSFTLNELRLLDFPIYYEVQPDTKVVVAMNEEEKRELQNLFLPQDLRVYTAAPHGPMTLVRTDWSARGEKERSDVIRLAARITATHVDAGDPGQIPIYYRFENENERLLVNVSAFGSCAEIARVAGIEVVPLEIHPVLVG